MVKKINHLGIAVRSIESALPYYRDVLGMRQEGAEEVPDQKVRVAFLRVGESRVELLEPTTNESPVARFLEKNGEGLHHVAYEVEDLHQALSALKAQDIRLIDEAPRRGAHGSRIAFLHPKATGGILTELCQSGDP